jgi:response regulator RpfG family c-di-GMP phosphodiesterase
VTTYAPAVSSLQEAKWQILVVDTDAQYAEQCRAILSADGHEVRVTSTRTQAIRQLRTTPADLVIADIGGAELEGIRLLAQIKELYPEVGVIVMTPAEAIEEALEAIRRGAADFLSKPFEPQELRRMTRSCLKSLSAERDGAFLSQANAVVELSRLLSSSVDPRIIPVKGLEIACRSFEADAAALLGYNALHGTLSVTAQAGRGLSRWEIGPDMNVNAEESIVSGKAKLSADERSGDCYAYVPVRFEDQVRGVLCLRRAGGPWFHEKSSSLLEMFAGHLAVAMETTRMREIAARQVQDLEELLTECRLLSLTTDADRLAKQLLDGARRLEGAEVSAVILQEQDGPRLLTAPPIESDSELAEAVRLRMLGLLDTSHRARGTREHRALRTFISAPLRAHDAFFGVVAVFSSRQDGFSPEDAQRLSAIAESASIAAANTEALGRVSVMYHETLDLFGRMVDDRCLRGDGHSGQVRTFAGQLARALGITGNALYRIEDGALLHDIGKLHVPETLLRKPGALTAEEFALVAAHPAHGAAMLQTAPHLHDLIPIVRHHHEAFNGSGYPDKLAGDAIPLGARITALADVFDALVSHRAYRAAVPVDEARRVIETAIGTQFDPELARMFLSLPLEEMIEH